MDQNKTTVLSPFELCFSFDLRLNGTIDKIVSARFRFNPRQRIVILQNNM